MSKTAKQNNCSYGKRRITGALLSAAIILLILWLIWGNTALMTSEITVQDARIPASFDGFRIAHVSDIHDASFGEDNAALIDLLTNLAPDIIVITGDLIDSNRTDIDAAISFAQHATNIAPVYYVTGNHEGALMEYWLLREGMEQCGVHILSDKAETIEIGDEVISIIGLDDPNFATREDIALGFDAMIQRKLNALVTTDNYSVLLAHRPEYIDAYSACGVNLVLSGHAHGGQVRVPFIGGLIAPGQGLFPKYDSGLYTRAGTAMIVSRGLGNSVFPLRVNNRPEVVLITLKNAVLN